MSQSFLQGLCVGVYFGLFDLMYNGYFDFIECSVLFFDIFYVVVFYNEVKKVFFLVEECVVLIEEFVVLFGNCVVEIFIGLFVDYVLDCGIMIVVCGLCLMIDFDYELLMILMNWYFVFVVDMIFLLLRQDCLYLLSCLIKEVCGLGGDVSELVLFSVYGLLFVKFE